MVGKRAVKAPTIFIGVLVAARMERSHVKQGKSLSNLIPGRGFKNSGSVRTSVGGERWRMGP